MTVILDRIEENVGVVELPNRSFAEIPLCLIPDAKEGDVIHIRIDQEETERRAEKIHKLMGQLFDGRE